MANGFNNLALTSIAARDYPKAEDLLNQALTIRRELTDHYGAATALVGLGATARLQGQPERARTLLQEGLTLARKVGDKHVMAIFLMEFGLLASSEGDAAGAIPLLAASEHLFHKIGGSPGSAIRGECQEVLTTARAMLDGKTWDTLWSQGQTAPIDQTISQLLEN